MGVNRKRIYLVCLIGLVLLSVGEVNGLRDKPIITPRPMNITHGNEHMVLKDCISLKSNANDDFVKGIMNIYGHSFFRNHKTLKFGSKCSSTIVLSIKHPEIIMPAGFDPKDQYYRLNADKKGKISIIANYKVGVIRAMDTLSQIFDRTGDQITLPHLPFSIVDQPRYGHIGLSLDISRNFYPVDVIKKIIDGLRMTKVNALHLHLTDDDSFPIMLPSFPGMTEFTALTPEEHYTVLDLEEIREYAYERGIKVIPEFDVPGHTRSIGLDPSLKHIMTCMDLIREWPMVDDSKIHGGPASSVMNPTLNETYEFIESVINDFKKIFTKSDYFHLGGDEVQTERCWDADAKIKKWMNKHNMHNGEELFHYFQNRVGEIAKEANTRTAHWVYDDNWNLKWDEGSILQYWGASENIKTFQNVYPDHQHILSVHELFYLDCGLGNRYGMDLCNPYQTWAKIRMFEPTDYYQNGNEQLLGGEACMWSELNTVHNVFDKIWPRLAVISDIFWSPKLEAPFNWGNIVEGLVKFRDELRANGIPANQISSRYGEAHPHEVFGAFTGDISRIEKYFS